MQTTQLLTQLLHVATFPLNYVYPREMRAMRDLLRRCSQLAVHVQRVNQQCDHGPVEQMLQYACACAHVQRVASAYRSLWS